jgi:hypothetical protein
MSLAVILEEGLEGLPIREALMGARLRNYIGKTVYTALFGQAVPHIVVGTTFATLSNIVVEEETFVDFYQRRYGITLKHLDQEAIVCQGQYYLPCEICFISKPLFKNPWCFAPGGAT